MQCIIFNDKKNQRVVLFANAERAEEEAEVANSDERRRLRVAYNSLFRKTFNYRNWESVTDLLDALQWLVWDELLEKRISAMIMVS